MSFSTRACSTATATSMCSSSTPRKHRRTRSDQDHRVESRAGSSHAAPPADAMVPQHLVLEEGAPKPSLRSVEGLRARKRFGHLTPQLGENLLHCEGEPQLLFTENETNNERIFRSPNQSPYVKDAFHRYLIEGQSDAINPAAEGTKAAAHYTGECGTGSICRDPSSPYCVSPPRTYNPKANEPVRRAIRRNRNAPSRGSG